MKQIFIFSLIVFSSFSLNAQESKEIETENSVYFKIKNFGVNVEGHFEKVEINAVFNAKDELTAISATVEINSISTGMESRDNHILKEDFFYAEKHKTIMLKMIALKKESLVNYLLTANLTIKGISKQIKIPIQIEKAKESLIVTANFEINRKGFNVGGSSLVLGKNVKISVIHSQRLKK